MPEISKGYDGCFPFLSFRRHSLVVQVVARSVQLVQQKVEERREAEEEDVRREAVAALGLVPAAVDAEYPSHQRAKEQRRRIPHLRAPSRQNGVRKRASQSREPSTVSSRFTHVATYAPLQSISNHIL